MSNLLDKKIFKYSLIKHKSTPEMNGEDSLDFSDIKLNYKRICQVSKW